MQIVGEYGTRMLPQQVGRRAWNRKAMEVELSPGTLGHGCQPAVNRIGQAVADMKCPNDGRALFVFFHLTSFIYSGCILSGQAHLPRGHNQAKNNKFHYLPEYSIIVSGLNKKRDLL